MSNKLNQNLSVINILRVDFIFSVLHNTGYEDKLNHKIKVAYSNIESTIKLNRLLFDPLTIMQVCHGCLLSMLLYIIATTVLDNFINTGKVITRIELGDHEFKRINFADHTTIFLRDITCLNRIQVILTLYENTKIN